MIKTMILIQKILIFMKVYVTCGLKNFGVARFSFFLYSTDTDQCLPVLSFLFENFMVSCLISSLAFTGVNKFIFPVLLFVSFIYFHYLLLKFVACAWSDLLLSSSNFIDLISVRSRCFLVNFLSFA